VDVQIEVNTGPLSYFGITHLSGNTCVHPFFFTKKTSWKVGQLYNPKAVQETQNALENASLFNSVEITHAEELSDNGLLPIFIEVEESKHRTFGAGINYATEIGPGIILEWEDRNIRGMGEKLNFKTNVWHDNQDATLFYLIPDFMKRNQDFLWVAEYDYEKLDAYTESAFSLSGVIEEQINKKLRISYGGMFKELALSRSDNNRTYTLGKIPLYVRYTKTNDILDPTNGLSVTARCIPTMQLISPCFSYCITRLIGAIYAPLNRSGRLSVAAKVNLGLISGSSRRTIPTSERFFAGSDNTIRGYRYLTVSPFDDVNDHEKPTGGRSMFITTFEARWHMTHDIGWTLFFDVGNVYRPPFPDFSEKMLKATGIGFRYYTPVGPLRFDFAFPLDRRRKPSNNKEYFDGPFQVYASVGQAF
jgi:translocation and assembly module TamA